MKNLIPILRKLEEAYKNQFLMNHNFSLSSVSCYAQLYSLVFVVSNALSKMQIFPKSEIYLPYLTYSVALLSRSVVG